MRSQPRLLPRLILGLSLILPVHSALAYDDGDASKMIVDRASTWSKYQAWDHSNDANITAEADILWPREGETFALNDKGMAMVFAIQNYAEAQKHDWYVYWTMCMNRTDKPGRRTCTGRASVGPYDLAVLRNDSASGDEAGDVYIEVNHSYWYSKSGKSDFDYTSGGIYDFAWKFGIGATCEFTNTSKGYRINEWIASGSFVVTVDPAATYPTPTPTTCGSYLGAVNYAGTTTYDFQSSVANSPGCVVTNPVTATPAPCRATLDAAQIATVASMMNWNGSNPNATASGAAETSAKSLAPAIDSKLRFAILSLIAIMMIECYL